jgi:aldehyde dehydrogenase family protein
MPSASPTIPTTAWPARCGPPTRTGASSWPAGCAPAPFGVNYYRIDRGAPFGGMKDSGIGREYGPEALGIYLEYQSVYASAARLRP